jgi:sugar phosphate isomerase/epimerase
MDLSMTTDYVTYLGNPEPYLRRIAEAGFTHIHWCHEWNTAHFYSDEEVKLITTWLRNVGLRLLDLHAPHGVGKGWGSGIEEERLAAVQLIRNRIDMTAELAGGAIVLHLPPKPSHPRDLDVYHVTLRRSLDDLEQHTLSASIKIALENMGNDDFEDLEQLFSAYDPDFLGLCYDSGHGNIGTSGLNNLERFRDRLVSIHIHDNDGTHDHHELPFSGTVDWMRLSQIIATSSYKGCVSLEANMRGKTIEESAYLREAYQAGSALARLIEDARGWRESLNK